MDIGVRLPASGASVSLDNIVTVASWAEELGYHSVWLGDHVVFPEQVDSFYPYDAERRWRSPANTNVLDPFLVLAWAANAGPNLKLGTSVMVVPLRHPILLAKQLATLDFLSKGRVIFGVGVGWMKEEFELIGAPFARRGPRTIEMIELMRTLWSGEMVHFQGEFYQVSGCKMHPRPVQDSIPIVWGGHSEAALKRVAQLGNGWHPTQLTLEQLAEGVQMLHHYCEQYNRDPASLIIIARPGQVYRIKADTLDTYAALGIEQVIIDPPMHDPQLKDFREEMERVSALAKLVPR